MYKPTVRMSDCYRGWLDDMVKYTRLDKNQLIRLALFHAPYNKDFITEVEIASRRNSGALPRPAWTKRDRQIWKEQSAEPEQRQRWEMPKSTVPNMQQMQTAGGGISIKVGGARYDIQEQKRKENVYPVG